MKSLRIGYVLKMFPRLSETFILNELLELERQDAELSVYSLMHPNDGRFHGRLAGLQLTAQYFPRDKPESTWNTLCELRQGLAPSFHRWSKAADFLRRHSIPGDLDLLLRSALIGVHAKAQGIQHLHAHFATVATRVAALVSMLTDIPFSFTAHAKDIFRTTVDRRLFAELVDRAAFAITVSDFNRDFIRSHTPGIDDRKLIRLYNGVDLDFFTPKVNREIPDIPHIISVGRLVPKKGFDHLLRALRACKDEGSRFRATVVGDGAEMQNLLALRRELDLDADVTFPGSLPQENVRELLAEASMVALACVPDQDGNMDALPTVLLEALALDVPVVSTRLTGIPEIVGDGAGLLVDPGDDAALARAIRELWEQIRSGARSPGRGRVRAERLFDLRKNGAVLRDLFADSASGNRISEAV